jgi:hypothetical protein
MTEPGGSQTLLAIDPGRAKCGIAVVSGPPPLAVLFQTVIPTESLVVEAAGLKRRFPQINLLLMGDGTGSAPLRRALRAAYPDLPFQLIGEHGTSERARRRFLEQNPPTGWRLWLPIGLRVPDQSYDDYVAVLLAEDYFSKNRV